MTKNNIYHCPICFFHRQKFGARSRLALATHLNYSHLQKDLVKYIVKQTPREKIE